MNQRPIHTYVFLVTALAGICLTVQDWPSLIVLPANDILGLFALLALGLISESVSVSFRVAQSTGHSSITFIPFAASVILFGPTAGVFFAAIISGVGEFFLHEKPLERAIFNVAMWILATTLAGFIYSSVTTLLGIHPGAFPDNIESGLYFIPFFLFVSTLFVINYVTVAKAISLDQGTPFRQILGGIVGSAGANLFYGILVSPLAFVVALLYEQLNVGGLMIAVLPLIFIRRSYVTNRRLQEVNQDLLRALVKAIETRDPYTSGHSLRVSNLAREIAQELGLPFRKVSEIGHAALLHDIGKIEVVYDEILKKPSHLSSEERRIIESHVTKGVEILRSISTFPDDVIAAVRHHHEREDGRGYPDGLAGEEIPLGAKIIKVCDAIDAMLSDRPYRSALKIDQVVEQLQRYAGSQFDTRIVRCVMHSGLLERHRDAVAATRGLKSVSILGHHHEGDDGYEASTAPLGAVGTTLTSMRMRLRAMLS